MRDVYQEVIDDGEAAIERFRSERVQENVELDFKTKTHPSKPGLTKEDRANLAEALSAFSNSMGGVVIWGVVAKKNGDGIDCASDLEPIDHIERFKSEVERAVSQVLMPRHDGIQIEMIRCSSAPKSGYLIIKVERSERRPYRSEAQGAKQYFKRVGDSNIAMEHYDIEDAFKRFVVPSLDVDVSLSDGGRRDLHGMNFRIVRITLNLRNNSSVSARYPYLMLDDVPPGLDPHSFSSQGYRFQGGADRVLHPDMEMKALELQSEFKVIMNHPDGATYVKEGTLGPIVIKCKSGCMHARPTLRTLEISEQEIARVLSISIL